MTQEAPAGGGGLPDSRVVSTGKAPGAPCSPFPSICSSHGRGAETFGQSTSGLQVYRLQECRRQTLAPRAPSTAASHRRAVASTELAAVIALARILGQHRPW